MSCQFSILSSPLSIDLFPLNLNLILNLTKYTTAPQEKQRNAQVGIEGCVPGNRDQRMEFVFVSLRGRFLRLILWAEVLDPIAAIDQRN
jgi:hypothetical protein